ncbi:MAG TPA: RNA polymerase sigma factor [Gammaproteobacteria bacterium]|nr:RNA polymerase sigma factor [Gammaproteobacteria bacterium]
MSDSVEQRFASLVQPHFGALYRAAMRLTRRRPDAEDLVQELCLRACSRLDDLGVATNPRAWLMRALYHLFVDATRRKRRRADASLASDDVAGMPHSEEPGPERAAEARRLHERLAAVWDELDPEQRALLSLHAEGHDLDELAAIFAVNKNALSARLHRARQRLAKLLAADEVEPALHLVENKR